ncbi:zinc finger CCCH domain-containing protein 13 [Anastrepha obliqua]|uniref:zinc finger CCCH domain-containing protein 13 n=1 Tax=Anastrepha obliqua TaxID=95512 RepID=UPI002408FC00|nr:zinc finger CCCH domain-containing protein 13 [Anastrepha obliqua]
MENFGSEIGQKMRSAVKAKLLELGTGGTAGYIDDELPDYVMIMVANKRSKQQMIADLNLFLGSQTELFVTWLHEVLQKLQEVTLPAVSATKKRKAEPKQEVVSKKDRKTSKRDRKTSTSKKSADEVQSTSVNTTEKSAGATNAPTVPPINSITDVFADVFLEKAKKTLSTTAEATAHIKKAKSNTKTTSTDTTTKTPTTKSINEKSISAIDITPIQDERCNGAGGDGDSVNRKSSGSTAPVSSGNREKDLAELAEIQKKIYAAKKHLRQLGELDDNTDDDDDFINLKEDGMEDEEGENVSPQETEMISTIQTEQQISARRSPIIFDAGEKQIQEPISTEKEIADISSHFTPPPQELVAKKMIKTSEQLNSSGGRGQSPSKQQNQEREKESVHDKQWNRDHERDKRETPFEATKRPVHERLGVRLPAAREPQFPVRRQREDKQLFVPSFRRKDNGNDRERERERDKDRELERERIRERERQRERERDRERERERNRGPAQLRGRSEDRRKDRDLERERERQRDRGRDRSRDQVNRRKENEPRMRRSLSPILRRTTSTNHNRALPNITVSAIVKPHYAKKDIVDANSDDDGNDGSSSTSGTSSDSEEDSANEDASPSHSSQTQRQRIGSRVIVAPVKPVESSEEEDKSLNSIIKIKPRAPVSPSKQACKTLLLRAVAEAQRSTIIKSRHKEQKVAANKISNIVKDPTDERKLYTKGYRERLNRGAKVTSTSSTSNLFRRATQNLVIKVESDMPLRKRRRAEMNEIVGTDQADFEEDEGEEVKLEEKYVPGTVFQRVDSNHEYVYVPQMIRIKNEDQESNESDETDETTEDGNDNDKTSLDKGSQRKTQFVVTLNDEKSALKFMNRASAALKRARSESPLQQVSSSSSISRSKRAEASSTTTTTTVTQGARPPAAREKEHNSRRSNIKSRLSAKVVPTSTVPRISDHDSSNSLPATPPLRRSDLIEAYRKPKEIKKIIIKNDTDDEEMSPKKLSSTVVVSNDNPQRKHKRTHSEDRNNQSARSATPTPTRKSEQGVSSKTPPKSKRTPISSQHDSRSRDLDYYDRDNVSASKRRSKSEDSAYERERERERDRDRERERERGRERERDRERDRERIHERAASRDYSADRQSGEERRKISTRNVEAKKYDNIPSLSSVTLDSAAVRVLKTKERCKYHPNCTKQFCDYYHPTAPCKSFPNCKYADKCLYSHPHCKYDLACTNLDCNYSHSGPRDPAQLVPQAPPLSSHVVPVQNYKSISATTAASTMCKYYPTCTKVGCTFYHPKPCRFGKNCINKLECNFYHHEVQSSSKFKWVASVV